MHNDRRDELCAPACLFSVAKDRKRELVFCKMRARCMVTALLLSTFVWLLFPIKNPKLIPFFLPRLGKATFGKKGCARPERKTTKKTMNGEQEDREEEEQEEKFKVYTKTGDDGTSSLYNLERRAKSDAVFDALGDCDETNVSVGIARVHAYDDCCEGDGKDGCFDGDVLPHLEIIQSRLLDVGSAVATPITSEKTKDGKSGVDLTNLT